MLDDLRAEALRLITLAGDTEAPCRNTVAVLISGGGHGNTSGSIAGKAATFLNVSQRRVPVHVIGIAPLTAAERTQLQDIATITGGKYTEITATMVDATTSATFVPELVNAINFAVSHSFADQGDFDLAPSVANPYGQESQYQVTSPIVGTVNLEGARDINNNVLPDTYIENPNTGTAIPQRSNIMITSGFSLPGFGMKLQAVRTYKPVVDATKSVGYKFVSDGTKLWVASAPAAASRNIYTTMADGTMADRVAVVENAPKTALALVFRDDIGFDATRFFDRRREHRQVSGDDRFGVASQQIEEAAAGDHSVLDDLIEARSEFAPRQRAQKRGIDDDQRRLMERADQVLAERVIDSNLAADRAIDLRQQGRRDLHEGDAAQKGCRGETSGVAKNASAERDDRAAAIGAGANERLVDTCD